MDLESLHLDSTYNPTTPINSSYDLSNVLLRFIVSEFDYLMQNLKSRHIFQSFGRNPPLVFFRHFFLDYFLPNLAPLPLTIHCKPGCSPYRCSQWGTQGLGLPRVPHKLRSLLQFSSSLCVVCVFVLLCLFVFVLVCVCVLCAHTHLSGAGSFFLCFSSEVREIAYRQ